MLSENNPQHLAQHLRLPGQQYDEETGPHYSRHRYYDPRQGRYITQDPIGLMGGWNQYGYPLDPVSGVDPLGLWALAVPAILEGINWLFVGSTVAGGAVLATAGDSDQSKTKDESLTNCPTMPPNDPCDKKLDKNLLKQARILDPHQVKKDWMGDRAQISRFDLCGCKDGRVVIKAQGCKGKMASSPEYNWK